MSSCTAVQEVLPWYANGSLDLHEGREVAAHLMTCEPCREELARIIRLNMEVKRALEQVGEIGPEARVATLRRTLGTSLARLDVGSFLLGFSFGAAYRHGRVPIRGDLKLLGTRIRLISSGEEVANGREGPD